MSTTPKTAIVTGCAGFIGSHVVEKLLEDEYHVYGVDKFDDYYPAKLKMQQIALSLGNPRFSLDVLDLADATALAAYAAKTPQPDVVVHLAAVAGVRLSVTDPARY